MVERLSQLLLQLLHMYVDKEPARNAIFHRSCMPSALQCIHLLVCRHWCWCLVANLGQLNSGLNLLSIQPLTKVTCKKNWLNYRTLLKQTLLKLQHTRKQCTISIQLTNTSRLANMVWLSVPTCMLTKNLPGMLSFTDLVCSTPESNVRQAFNPPTLRGWQIWFGYQFSQLVSWMETGRSVLWKVQLTMEIIIDGERKKVVHVNCLPAS